MNQQSYKILCILAYFSLGGASYAMAMVPSVRKEPIGIWQRLSSATAYSLRSPHEIAGNSLLPAGGLWAAYYAPAVFETGKLGIKPSVKSVDFKELSSNLLSHWKPLAALATLGITVGLMRTLYSKIQDQKPVVEMGEKKPISLQVGNDYLLAIENKDGERLDNLPNLGKIYFPMDYFEQSMWERYAVVFINSKEDAQRMLKKPLELCAGAFDIAVDFRQGKNAADRKIIESYILQLQAKFPNAQRVFYRGIMPPSSIKDVRLESTSVEASSIESGVSEQNNKEAGVPDVVCWAVPKDAPSIVKAPGYIDSSLEAFLLKNGITVELKADQINPFQDKQNSIIKSLEVQVKKKFRLVTTVNNQANISFESWQKFLVFIGSQRANYSQENAGNYVMDELYFASRIARHCKPLTALEEIISVMRISRLLYKPAMQKSLFVSGNKNAAKFGELLNLFFKLSKAEAEWDSIAKKKRNVTAQQPYGREDFNNELTLATLEINGEKFFKSLIAARYKLREDFMKKKSEKLNEFFNNCIKYNCVSKNYTKLILDFFETDLRVERFEKIFGIDPNSNDEESEDSVDKDEELSDSSSDEGGIAEDD